MIKCKEVKDKYPYYGPDKPETIKDSETGEDKQIMEPVEVGAILIENKTGKIISFVGGRDHKRGLTEPCHKCSKTKWFNHEAALSVCSGNGTW